MPLGRTALAVMLPLAVGLAACAEGEEDPQSSSPQTEPSSDDKPVVPAHEIAAPAPIASAQPPDVRTSIDERPNARAVAVWDFEPASADCNGWNVSGATAIRGIPSHGGSYACKLCADGSAPEMKLTQRVAGLPRGQWVVSAWLRRLVTTEAQVAARVSIDEATQTAGIPSSILLIDEWRLLGDPVDVRAEVASTSLSIVATAQRGDCILVDDVTVESATAKAAHSSLPGAPYVFMRR